MHGIKRRSLWGALVTLLLAAHGCSRPAGDSRAQRAETAIQWPQVTSVLDGTDVIALSQIPQVNFDRARIAGRFRSEQGGAEVLLEVREGTDALEIERTYREPETDPQTKHYRLNVLSLEGSADPQEGVYLKQSNDGVLLLEERPGVDAIPTDVWIHYVRE